MSFEKERQAVGRKGMNRSQGQALGKRRKEQMSGMTLQSYIPKRQESTTGWERWCFPPSPLAAPCGTNGVAAITRHGDE
jgi:hypothetical protein